MDSKIFKKMADPKNWKFRLHNICYLNSVHFLLCVIYGLEKGTVNQVLKFLFLFCTRKLQFLKKW